ncbi:4-hydroxy-tetrahydrodipicolinate reductase [Candidatus Johnevansia muelleri]|uniref:4-hydroxy-tetrahydrodipicolinate reductase n=1 Tax=Candidatus Johnevansia muelleri TaxID=1495769 RepID=A0A078KAS2_9GAMM|nr:4-hydroxy-tetrahydrodipicolinate reductase [Candidatus Evansia muelleri]
MILRVAVLGCNGRMGRKIVQIILKDKYFKLNGAIVRKNSKLIGIDIGELIGVGNIGLKISDSLTNIVNKIDILIDFTNPDFTMKNILFCKKYNKSIVIGTTGFSKKQLDIIEKYKLYIPFIFCANMSTGINILCKLIKVTTNTLKKENLDIEIIEKHHINKLDVPSGTTLMFARIINNTLTNYKLGISSIRLGDIIGEHKIIFYNKDEIIEISHKALNRYIFANGALIAANWLKNKQVGCYNMQDVLNLKNNM